jgi:predicted nucleotidyltransferase
MDTENLLKLLNAHQVKYVVIGASAFPAHGYARVTLDVDILIEPTVENARRTLAALSEFGYDVVDLTEEILLTKKVLFRQYIQETDIHPDAAGVTFEQVWKNKIRKRLGETMTNFAGLDDLIKMKRAANRAKDREDLKVLRELKRRKRARK